MYPINIFFLYISPRHLSNILTNSAHVKCQTFPVGYVNALQIRGDMETTSVFYFTAPLFYINHWPFPILWLCCWNIYTMFLFCFVWKVTWYWTKWTPKNRRISSQLNSFQFYIICQISLQPSIPTCNLILLLQTLFRMLLIRRQL